MSLSVGIDLSDDYTAICTYGAESVVSVPTVIGREKKTENWYIGEEAYRMTLSGKTVLTDKLVRLLDKKGTATIAGRRYSAEELLGEFLRELLLSVTGNEGIEGIDSLTVCIHSPGIHLIDSVTERLYACGIRNGCVKVISHEEAFAYYLLMQEKSLYSNSVAMFDLSDETLSYYEINMQRGQRKNTISVSKTDAEEAFHIDILKTEAGRKLGDSIITSAARSLMDRKIYSSVFLTGKGFRTLDWAKEFRGFILQRRRVLVEPELFAIGARQEAVLRISGEELPYSVFCDTRLDAEISIKVAAGGRESRLLLAQAGDCWYSAGSHIEIIPWGQDYIDILVAPVVKTKPAHTVRIMLNGFAERPDRCSRMAMELEFLSASRAHVSITDMGFGDLYPAEDHVIEEEFAL